MTCKKIKNNLIFYLEGTLPAHEAKAFSNHLNSCQQCNEVFIKIQSTLYKYSEIKYVNPNPFFATRIIQQIQNLKKQNYSSEKFITKWLLQPALITIFVITLFFAGFIIISYKNHENVSSENYSSSYTGLADQYFMGFDNSEVFELYYSTK